MKKFESDEERRAYLRDAQDRHRAKKRGEIRAEDIASGRLIKVALPTGQRLEIRLCEREEAMRS